MLPYREEMQPVFEWVEKALQACPRPEDYLWPRSGQEWLEPHLAELAEQVGAVHLGDTGFAYLVDEQGQVLAHPDPAFAAELRD